MQSAEDDVARFGCRHGNFEGFAVANFAHQDCFRRLPQGRAQTVGEIWKILPEFPLADGGLAMRVKKLDRVFQSHNMNFLRFVQLVYHRGQRGRFAGAGRRQ